MVFDMVGQTIYELASFYHQRTKMEPLDILDKICLPFRGLGVDFNARDCGIDLPYEWLTDPRTPLGELIVMAFSPDRDYRGLHEADDALIEVWWEQAYEPFRRRYGFRYLPFEGFRLSCMAGGGLHAGTIRQ